jgi:hypothetical protein
MLRTALPVAFTLALALPARAQTTYDTVFNQMKDLAPRADRVATVHGLVLRRDVMELRLDSGAVYLLTPVAGRTVGVWFVGAGTVSFVPPLEVERANLRRVLGDSAVSRPITSAVFIFADSTLAELEHSLAFTSGAETAGGNVSDALDYLVVGHDRYVDPSLMTALLNGTANGFFAAYVKPTRGEDVLIEIDPMQAEEVLLLRRGRLPGQRAETVCQFQRAEDLRANIAVKTEQPEPLEVDAYGIDATIDGNYNFSATATVRVTGRRDRLRWIRFLLYSELEVDSIADETGAHLDFFRADRTEPLWVRLGQEVGAGEVRTVRIAYHGGLIGFGSTLEGFLPPWWDPARRDMPPVFDRWAFIKSTETWYPRYSFWQPAAMDLAFHTPKEFKFASIGRLVESRTEGKVLTTHWVTELPTQQASFNIGQFEEFEIKDPHIPPVTVHVNADAHRYIQRLIPQARNPQEQVGADVVNSLAFFTQMFGPPLFQHYYATEIPYFHGQAFPGMIHLSWWTFLGMSTTGEDESFRAHEVAHQWWGIGVAPASYRDVWLAEGFAEFAGLWYMQMILHDNDNYFKQLREARQEIRRQRERAVPIALGWRAAESRTGSYDLVVYKKGAWVLHMLRNLLLDLSTMNEDAFKAMMQDFYQTYRGKSASTEDFQRVVERHVGQPMDWFFRQWVYGTAIPTYTLSWYSESRPDGKYTLRVRVRQEDVPDDFTMHVPLLIRFASGQAIVRVVVRGPLTNTSLTLPEQPTRLELNPLESVLAEVKTEGWRP